MSELLPDISREISKAATLIRNANYVAVLSGAGTSTPSGIPDFRSTGSGLWTRFDPLEYASLHAFRYSPEKFFEWMRPLARQIFYAVPNPAHSALALLENNGFIHIIITQNIDGLHKRAGSQHILEVHGSFQSLTCIGCYRNFPSDNYFRPYIETGLIPRCPDCNNILKPDIILIEEQMPFQTWQQAQTACDQCDLLIITGSSLEMMPVAGLPTRALQHGAHLIIINQSPTYIDVRADVLINADVAEILPKITEAVIGE
jgi:NAD-dependent deacetylase